jgi:hypothetical protein
MTCPHCGVGSIIRGHCTSLLCCHQRIAALEAENASVKEGVAVFEGLVNGWADKLDAAKAENAALRAEMARMSAEAGTHLARIGELRALIADSPYRCDGHGPGEHPKICWSCAALALPGMAEARKQRRKATGFDEAGAEMERLQLDNNRLANIASRSTSEREMTLTLEVGRLRKENTTLRAQLREAAEDLGADMIEYDEAERAALQPPAPVDDRRPPPPETLVGALQDPIGPASGKLIKSTPIPAQGEAAVWRVPNCPQCYDKVAACSSCANRKPADVGAAVTKETGCYCYANGHTTCHCY